MRPLTMVEAACAVSLAGSMLAVMVPAFVRNVHASRLTEPLDGLARIGTRSLQLADGAAEAAAFPASVPQTPAIVPQGELKLDAPGTWDHPTWRVLDFAFRVPHAYSFEYVSTNAAAHSVFQATARGDLDGDGVLSRFEIGGDVRPGSMPRTFPLEVVREVE